jgi:REP element-mobilizing transposase RayT
MDSLKFQNKFRIDSARAVWWDYVNQAAYFITICTRNMCHYFGEILDEKMQLSVLGEIANKEWLKSPSIRPDMNLKLDEFVVMPNHFHAIIWIGENEFNANGNDGRDAMRGVSTPHITSDITSDKSPNNSKNKFGPQSKNLGSIVRGFKSAVTTASRKEEIEFGWQSRFHDSIIRDEASYQRIRNYIINNPKNWKIDKFRT